MCQLIRASVLALGCCNGATLVKRLSAKRRAWLAKRAARLLRHRIRARGAWASRTRGHVGKNQTLRPPSVFSLSDNYEQVASFFQEFREAALWKGVKVGRRWVRHRIIVDLCDIQTLAPSAALMLAAELDRWRRLQSFRPTIANLHKYHPEVLRLCSELGLFELVNCAGVPAEEPTIGDGDLRMIKMACGQRVDGKVADALREELWQLAKAGANPFGAYETLVEAMDNAIAHAYPVPRAATAVPWLRKTWWASGSVDVSRNRLEMFFYDQGVGIPATLHREGVVEWARGLMAPFDLSDDAAMIIAALRVGRSGRRIENPTGGTRKTTGTGLGLSRMCDFVDAFPGSKFRIRSGRGNVLYTSGGDVGGTTMGVPLGGTLLEFTIELAQGNAADA